MRPLSTPIASYDLLLICFDLVFWEFELNYICDLYLAFYIHRRCNMLRREFVKGAIICYHGCHVMIWFVSGGIGFLYG
jgi:hypothetical protein